MRFTNQDRTVHNSVQQLRKANGITQEMLARKLGVTRQTIISIEKGKYSPSLALALSMAKSFNVKVEDVFTL